MGIHTLIIIIVVPEIFIVQVGEGWRRMKREVHRKWLFTIFLEDEIQWDHHEFFLKGKLNKDKPK